MIKTFLALLKEGSIDKAKDSQFILTTLFRPGGNGLVREDHSPATPMELIMKTVQDKSKDKP